MISIRDERPGDAGAVRELNRRAFARDEEGRLVDAIRAAGAATLSLVAADEGQFTGPARRRANGT